ncbi:MAG: TonB-dependent receptor domain-containing protein, partial [bacterium]
MIHFSYGIFQQIPEYSQLFNGDELKLTAGQGIQGPFGNPDLNPQRTTTYELGLKQQISDNIGIDLTGYYRDIRDWISTSPPIPTHSAGVTYSKGINRDFANARGITLIITRRLANGFAFDVDYTYQIVQGTNSSPQDEYLALTAGAEPRKKLSPLNWDQRHAFNLNFYNADQELFYRCSDDLYSRFNYRPDTTDLSRRGLGLLMDVRTFAWTQVLINDAVFFIHDIKNDGTKRIPKTSFLIFLADYVGGDGTDDQPYID